MPNSSLLILPHHKTPTISTQVVLRYQWNKKVAKIRGGISNIKHYLMLGQRKISYYCMLKSFVYIKYLKLLQDKKGIEIIKKL
jgi:hypothetical protein